ncbi:MAG: type II toxin-antitoxin system prevent-host-death family antitoxin [Sulfuricellaceae bacterium]
MQQQISLHEINQHLSQYIHAVEEGAEYVITRRGKPVARIVPLIDVEEQRVLTPKQEAALERIRQRVEQGCFRGIGKMTRDEIYQERLNKIGPTRG